jgi:cytoskeletal protein RodZ
MYLRETRTGKGLPLEEVATATRVAQRYLEALEADALQELPAPVFTRGYIRAFCQVLGVPADEALARYDELLRDSAIPSPPPGLPRQIRSRARGSLLVSLVLLIVFGLGVAVLTVGFPRRDQPAPVRTPASAPPTPAAAPPAASTLEETETSRSAEAPSALQEGRPARLVARTTEPTWISVETDDGRVSQELLPKDAMREWTSPNRFIVTIGNAGGVALELNGRPLPPLGASGAVIRKLVLPYGSGAPKP